MVFFALSTLGIQSKSFIISRPWFLYSGAFIHMKVSFEYLHNLHYYHGNQKIQIDNGNTLSITDFRDINYKFHR